MTTQVLLPNLSPGQFRIFDKFSDYARQTPTVETIRVQVGDFIVECDQTLHISYINDNKNNVHGVILGHAFVADNRERLSSEHFHDFFSSTHLDDAFEQLYERLFGTFIIVLNMGTVLTFISTPAVAFRRSFHPL